MSEYPTDMERLACRYLLNRQRDNERKRCADLVHARADIARESAEAVRKDGTWNTAWPFCKPRYAVMPGYESVARVHDELARALDQIEKAISEGWTLKEPHDG